MSLNLDAKLKPCYNKNRATRTKIEEKLFLIKAIPFSFDRLFFTMEY